MKQKKQDYYKILDKNNRVMYTGGNSCMSLEEAKKLVDRSNGETIVCYSAEYNRPMWEVL